MMNKKELLSVLCFCFFLTQSIYSQVITQYFPEGDALKSLPLLNSSVKNENVYKMPPFDLEKLEKEDAEKKGQDVPCRFGKGFDVSYTLDDGQWVDVENGRLWTMSFKSEGAVSLNYIFENFFLPEGAYLYITNLDETVLFGPVTSEALIKKHDSFLTDIISGEQSTIYLFEPLKRRGESTLTVKRVVHGYRGVAFDRNDGIKDASSGCNHDVVCLPAYENESNAVALVLLSSGDELCSGSLLMNTNYTFEPYFLTSFSAIDSDHNGSLSESEKDDASNWMFKFRYKRLACDINGYVTASFTYNKADFCSAWSNTKFALLKLKSNLVSNIGLTWLGWDRTGSMQTRSVCIHHPYGDVMKISVDNNSPMTGTYTFTTNFQFGVVELGSFGAPLLNQDKKVIGQLIYPFADINNTTSCNMTCAENGKLSQSWSGGGHSYDRLSDWLDPNNTGQTTMDSHTPPYISGPSLLSDTCDYQVANLPSGFSVVWSYVKNSGYNVTFQTNVPQTNYCRFINSPVKRVDVTITADIYNGSTLVLSVSKNASYYPPAIGTYSQHDTYNASQIWEIPETNIYEGESLELRPKCNIYIYSDLFIGANVTYSGDSPESWSNDNNGTITIMYPYSAHTWKYTTITATMYGQQVCEIPLRILPIIDPILPPIDDPLLLIDSSGSSHTITIVDKNALHTDNDQDIIWYLTINNLVTGRRMYSGTINERSTVINTTDWPSGAYAIQAQIGNKVIVQKQVVK